MVEQGRGKASKTMVRSPAASSTPACADHRAVEIDTWAAEIARGAPGRRSSVAANGIRNKAQGEKTPQRFHRRRRIMIRDMDARAAKIS